MSVLCQCLSSPCAEVCNASPPPAKLWSNVLAIKRHNDLQIRDESKESPRYIAISMDTIVFLVSIVQFYSYTWGSSSTRVISMAFDQAPDGGACIACDVRNLASKPADKQTLASLPVFRVPCTYRSIHRRHRQSFLSRALTPPERQFRLHHSSDHSQTG
jgi:hypothetical protein